MSICRSSLPSFCLSPLHILQGIPHLSDEGRTGRESIPPISADKMISENQGAPGVADTGKLNAVEQGQARQWGDKK
eukprot:1155613-Pelagomonas_calceolata.AAC.3